MHNIRQTVVAQRHKGKHAPSQGKVQEEGGRSGGIATHGLEYIREFYDPYRNVGGGQLSSIDNRSPRFGPELTFRLRKTFG